MKTAVALLVLVTCLPLAAYSPRADSALVVRDDWFGQDKFWHAALSFAMVGAFYHFWHCRIDRPVGESAAVSIGTTLGFGVLKEVFDARSGRDIFSLKDLTFDALGIGLGWAAFIAGDRGAAVPAGGNR